MMYCSNSSCVIALWACGTMDRSLFISTNRWRRCRDAFFIRPIRRNVVLLYSESDELLEEEGGESIRISAHSNVICWRRRRRWRSPATTSSKLPQTEVNTAEWPATVAVAGNLTNGRTHLPGTEPARSMDRTAGIEPPAPAPPSLPGKMIAERMEGKLFPGWN